MACSMITSAIAIILSKFDDRKGMAAINDFIADVAEEVDSMAYDLDYSVKQSKKINEKTGKPYINKSYEIIEVYDR